MLFVVCISVFAVVLLLLFIMLRPKHVDGAIPVGTNPILGSLTFMMNAATGGHRDGMLHTQSTTCRLLVCWMLLWKVLHQMWLARAALLERWELSARSGCAWRRSASRLDASSDEPRRIRAKLCPCLVQLCMACL